MVDKEFLEEFKIFIDSMEAPCYSEEQQKALTGEVAMTQEIFDSCVKLCSSEGNVKEFFDLFERFPICGETWCEALGKDISLINARLKKKNT